MHILTAVLTSLLVLQIVDTYDFDLVGTMEEESAEAITQEDADAILARAAGHVQEALGGQTQARRRASEAGGSTQNKSPRRAA